MPYDVSLQALAPNLALRNIHVRTVDAQYVGWNHAVTIAAGQAQSLQPKVLADRLIDPITKIPSFPDKVTNTGILFFPERLTERKSVLLEFHCFVFSQDGFYRELKFEKYLELRQTGNFQFFRFCRTQ